MKKITLLLLCVLGFQVQAQVTVKPGVRAGLNISNFTNTDFDNRTDFYVGGLVAIKLANFYTLQPEITYSRQGAQGEIVDFSYNPAYNSINVYRDVDYEIQYLSFAVMNKFRLVEGFHVAVGPSLDFRVGDNFDEINTDIEDLDLGFIGGLGYTFPVGLTVEARYKFGFIDIFGNNLYEDYYDEDNNGNYDDIYLNSVIQLGVSYAF